MNLHEMKLNEQECCKSVPVRNVPLHRFEQPTVHGNAKILELSEDFSANHV